jgi:uncharacterized DUF497 family protein
MMPDAFRWNDWNLEHAAKHGVTREECEKVVSSARHRHHGDGKMIAVGRGNGGRWIQVVFVYDEPEGTVYVIHARPLIDREKRRERKRR